MFTRRTGNPDGELLGMDLLRLALERAGNRHEAVEVIVQLLERHGQGGACSYERPKFTYDNSYLIADPAGAIVLETLLAVDRGAQQDRVVGGSWLIAQRMADDLGDVVRLGVTVQQIDHGADPAVILRDGERIGADRVIVALPPTLAGRLDYAPALPQWRDQLTQRTPAGSVAKTFAVYDRPFWRDAGLNGQVASDRGPVKVAFDVSPPNTEIGVLLGFVEGGEARRWARLTEAERRRTVIDSLVRYFGAAAAHPIEYVEKDWSTEQFTRGCYGAHFAPGVWTSYGEALREPIGPLYWAGAEYATDWNGYMEGAVRAGERTADLISSDTR